jgi:hypothetical protein
MYSAYSRSIWLLRATGQSPPKRYRSLNSIQDRKASPKAESLHSTIKSKHHECGFIKQIKINWLMVSNEEGRGAQKKKANNAI